MTKLKKGEMTPMPVKSQFGYHIIKLDDTREAQFPAFEGVKGQIQATPGPDVAAQLQKFQDDLRKARPRPTTSSHPEQRTGPAEARQERFPRHGETPWREMPGAHRARLCSPSALRCASPWTPAQSPESVRAADDQDAADTPPRTVACWPAAGSRWTRHPLPARRGRPRPHRARWVHAWRTCMPASTRGGANRARPENARSWRRPRRVR
jgi:hypothetical protein